MDDRKAQAVWARAVVATLAAGKAAGEKGDGKRITLDQIKDELSRITKEYGELRERLHEAECERDDLQRQIAALSALLAKIGDAACGDDPTPRSTEQMLLEVCRLCDMELKNG